MSEIIENYYKNANIAPILIKMKMNRFSKHADIASEFEYWIKEKKYKEFNCIKVEGYTAKSISKLSKFLDGEGAFVMLIELRENRDNALKKIASGFKLK